MFDLINELNRQSNQWFYETTGISFEHFLLGICWLITVVAFFRTLVRTSEVPKLMDEVDKLKTNIEGLREKNSELESEVNALRKSGKVAVLSLEEDISNLVEEVESLRSYTRNLDRTTKGTIQDLTGDVSDLRDELHALSVGVLVREL